MQYILILISLQFSNELKIQKFDSLDACLQRQSELTEIHTTKLKNTKPKFQYICKSQVNKNG